MKKFFACLCVLLLASCQTTQIDSAIQKSLPQICGAAETAYAVLTPFIVAGKIKPSTAAKVENAYGQLEIYCASKETATLASTLISATTAYLVLSTALKEAKKQETSN